MDWSTYRSPTREDLDGTLTDVDSSARSDEGQSIDSRFQFHPSGLNRFGGHSSSTISDQDVLDPQLNPLAHIPYGDARRSNGSSSEASSGSFDVFDDLPQMTTAWQQYVPSTSALGKRGRDEPDFEAGNWFEDQRSPNNDDYSMDEICRYSPASNRLPTSDIRTPHGSPSSSRIPKRIRMSGMSTDDDDLAKWESHEFGAPSTQSQEMSAAPSPPSVSTPVRAAPPTPVLHRRRLSEDFRRPDAIGMAPIPLRRWNSHTDPTDTTSIPHSSPLIPSQPTPSSLFPLGLTYGSEQPPFMDSQDVQMQSAFHSPIMGTPIRHYESAEWHNPQQFYDRPVYPPFLSQDYQDFACS